MFAIISEMQKNMPARITDFLVHWDQIHPHKIFLYDQTKKRGFTFREVRQFVSGARSYFEKSALKRGDIITLYLRNGLEFCLLFLASLDSELVVFPYPYLFSPAELIRDLRSIPSRAIFIDAERTNEFEGSGLENIVPIGPDSPGIFEKKDKESSRHVRNREKNADEFACIFPSAGASYHPRGIYYSHRNIMALIPSICRAFHFKTEEVHLILLPLALSASLNYSFFPALLQGSTVVLTESFWNIKDRFWKICNEHAVSYVQTIPTVLHTLLHLPKTFENVPSLNYIGCGSAPLDKKMQTDFFSRFGLPVANLYGLTETGPTHVDYPLDPGWKPGSIGKSLDVNQVSIVDREGNPVPQGVKGEILIKGDNVFPGYAVLPELTPHAFVRGFFRTGDIGYHDEDGLYYFSHRLKDLIIRGGLNIHPDEINEVLLSHPGVLQCRTSGIRDEFFGESIKSQVTVRAGSRLSPQDLKEFCASRLSPIKIPDVIRLLEQPQPH